MKKFLILLALFSNFRSDAQSSWKEASGWKIYTLPDRLIFNIPVDSLPKYTGVDLDRDTMQRYLSTSVKLADSIQPIWMGGFLLSYLYNGQPYEFQVSSYGGFFFDQRFRLYYEVPKSIVAHLLTYINRKLSSSQPNK